ncbi:vitelline membrane outer layer protein 1-like [Sphaerodactylus townsendi]|uniref:vitelline membrane outer layer protein 1-like n=1 Tax=Sphaerodactylus townsendi TaxID=933632 RepID=UPI002025EC76|nr:vitelline membrane outer layer protein 1-like [Sphaerodactylus townsendi]
MHFSLNLSQATEGREFIGMLSVTNGGQHGDWGEVQSCSNGYANQFSLMVHGKQGAFQDDTSLNGIRLYCTDGSVITSLVGRHGDWSHEHSCKSGFLKSFSLRVFEFERGTDNTVAENIKFRCTDGTETEGHGHNWGRYGSWSAPCPKGGICGIQTRVDLRDRQSTQDLTGLNNVKFFCCS